MNAELLSPAGNPEIFKAVVDAGADAVYFGGEKFGARAYAENFSVKEAEKCISYAHVRGKKAYLTVNTLLKNTEMEREAYDYLKAYYEVGIDAYIVQDMGVFAMIKDCFPEAHIHASTQMTIANRYGAKLLKDMGAHRVVTSRELSLNEIKNIHENSGIEIESFVHGALCVCYSGQCLMSSVIGQRSGNRGRCAQPCRLPYKAEGVTDSKGDYILSPKDFCAIDHIPKMLLSGVYSFKIEGRMKQLSYAAGVTAIYRKYMDMALNAVDKKAEYKVSDKDHERLMDLGNRSGFTDTYLFMHNSEDMITYKAPFHKTNPVSDIENSFRKMPVKAEFTGKIDSSIRLKLIYEDKEVSVSGKNPEKALKKATSKQEIIDKLIKLGDTEFILDTDDIVIDLSDDIFIPMSDINALKREAAEKLRSEVYDRKSPEKRAVRDKKELVPKTKRVNAPYLLVTVETEEQFNTVIKAEYRNISHIGISTELYEKNRSLLNRIKESGRSAVLVFPPVLRGDRSYDMSGFDLFLISSLDEAGYMKEAGVKAENVIFSERLYTYSDRTLDAYRELGYRMFTAPYELNRKELSHRDNGDSFINIYSFIPLMTTANCIHKNMKQCDKTQELLKLKDRQNKTFFVKNHCDNCYNVIYNGIPYEILGEKENLQKMGFAGFKIDFTIENERKTSEILNAFKTGQKISGDRTGGHYGRGVE
ncbi:MAG: U32 family peptidase [Lachnospiraceae bacterium]|nr:U32 family peptidase [Lachnospiraceae bacterium]